jgi:hypothetical protein
MTIDKEVIDSKQIYFIFHDATNGSHQNTPTFSSQERMEQTMERMDQTMGRIDQTMVHCMDRMEQNNKELAHLILRTFSVIPAVFYKNNSFINRQQEQFERLSLFD